MTQGRKMNYPNPHSRRQEPNSSQGHLTVPSVVTGSPLPRPVPAWYGMDRILGTTSQPLGSPYQVWRDTDRKLKMSVSFHLGRQAPGLGLGTDSVSGFPPLCHCPGIRMSRFPEQPSSDLAKVKDRGVMTLASQVPPSTHKGPCGPLQPILGGQGK